MNSVQHLSMTDFKHIPSYLTAHKIKSALFLEETTHFFPHSNTAMGYKILENSAAGK